MQQQITKQADFPWNSCMFSLKAETLAGWLFSKISKIPFQSQLGRGNEKVNPGFIDRHDSVTSIGYTKNI